MANFVGQRDFSHSNVPVTGVLLVNMGTPDAPTPQALRPYLRQFLSDPRVIEVWRPLWLLILYCIVLVTRPRRSAKLYQRIWTKDGSPLLVYGKRQTAALKKLLEHRFGGQIAVELGMTYGRPSIESALNELRKRNMQRLLVLPLYPQYSGTTTAAGFDAVARELTKWRWVPELRTINCYHDDPSYIAALVKSIREFWDREGEPERLMMSFHGIPKSYFMNGDPYHCQCLKTGRLVAEGLKLPAERYQVCFQSLFGKEEWLKPYTIVTLAEWGRTRVKSVDVVCPGFTADCVETIDEIDRENREAFLHAGGGSFRYISAPQ